MAQYTAFMEIWHSLTEQSGAFCNGVCLTIKKPPQRTRLSQQIQRATMILEGCWEGETVEAIS